MDFGLRDRVALVTGGSRGIGRAVVEALAERRWRVFFCSRSEEVARRTAAELADRFVGPIAGRATDVRSQSQVESLVGWVVEEAGRVDCLINNAGIGGFAPVDEIDGDDWRRLVETNLNGPFYAIRAVTPAMKRQGGGWIINIASLAARNPFAGGAAYNASKFGLLGLSDAAMLDLRQHGIRVTVILPGSVSTEFSGRSPGPGDAWKLGAEDVARAVTDLLDYPDRALPSRLELRPTRPPGK